MNHILLFIFLAGLTTVNLLASLSHRSTRGAKFLNMGIGLYGLYLTFNFWN